MVGEWFMEANVARYNTALPFPQLDCFPGDLIRGPENQASNGNIQVAASLSATSDIGDRLKHLQRYVQRGVATNEKEALMNGLAEISQDYQYSWEDSDDSGED